MRLLEVGFYRICLFICLSSVCYMTYLQFMYYLSNEDLASISYQKFNQEEKDEYPIFSVCFLGYNGEIYKESHDIFKSRNVTILSYRKYLYGELEDSGNQFSTIKFDDVALDINESYLLKTSEFTSQNGERTFWDVPFQLTRTMQNVDYVCVSKSMPYRKNTKQYFDYLALNSSKMADTGINVYLFIHQKGRLFREWNSIPYIIYPDEKLKHGTYRVFDIGQVDILRKRENSNMACEKVMKDEDEYISRQIILNAGCIPTHWENFAGNVGLNRTTRMCKSRTDYNSTNSQYWNTLKSFDSVHDTKRQPCTEMVALVTAKDETDNIKDCPFFFYLYSRDNTSGILYLQFNYLQDVYREIINTKAYTGESLLGQVGGFVGIYENTFVQPSPYNHICVSELR